MAAGNRRTGDGSRASGKVSKAQTAAEGSSSSAKRFQGPPGGAREAGDGKGKDAAGALGGVNSLGEALFEWYAFCTGCGNAALLSTMYLSQEQLSHDLNQPAVALIILFLLRRPLETHLRIAMQKSHGSWGAKAAVAAYILFLAVYTWKAAVSMPMAQLTYLMNTYWLWVLAQWLGSASKPKPGWSDGSDGSRGGARGGLSGKGQGHRVPSPLRRKSATGSQPIAGKGSASVGPGSAVAAGLALPMQPSGSRVYAGDDAEKFRGLSIEDTISSEMWRMLRVVVGEIVCSIYITCVLPVTAVRKEHIFLNQRLCGWLVFYVSSHVLILLAMKSIAGQWPRLHHWADILGCWHRSMPVFKQQAESLAVWMPGTCYTKGFLVRKNDEVYVATGKLNAADPESHVSQCLQFVAGPSIPLVNLGVALQLALLLANFLLTYLNVYIGLCFRRAMQPPGEVRKPMQGT